MRITRNRHEAKQSDQGCKLQQITLEGDGSVGFLPLCDGCKANQESDYLLHLVISINQITLHQFNQSIDDLNDPEIFTMINEQNQINNKYPHN